MTKREIAIQFGDSLDSDEYAITRSVLADDCEYIIGNEKLLGPIEISKSYENNMIEGKKKLDKLEWGKCKIEDISETEFFIHFTDYLTHKSKEFVHRCKQKVIVGQNYKIVKIEHISDPEEQEKLNSYYKSVGFK